MKKCIACGHALSLKPLLTLENMPASAQHMPDAAGLRSDRPLTLPLCQCPACGLVQFDTEPVFYYRDVIRAGGYTRTMTELRREQFRHLIETYGLKGKRFIEVGCGRGEFLKVLREFPVEAFGTEHDPALVKAACLEGLLVRRDFPETAEHTFKGAPFDAFLSFNFLEHQPDPAAMLLAARKNLKEGGIGLITVPSFEYILEHGGYYELIRDHIAYYTFDSLGRLLSRCGFTVLEQEIINRDTISVVVKKETAALGAVPAAPGLNREDLTRVTPAGLSDFIACREALSAEIMAFKEALAQAGKKAAVWGAGHQGFTLLSTTPLKSFMRYIIDSAPFKQGLYAPASHLPIVALEHFFEEPVDALLITAPGYTDEIAASIRERFGGAVEIFAIRSRHLERME